MVGINRLAFLVDSFVLVGVGDERLQLVGLGGHVGRQLVLVAGRPRRVGGLARRRHRHCVGVERRRGVVHLPKHYYQSTTAPTATITTRV